MNSIDAVKKLWEAASNMIQDLSKNNEYSRASS